MRKIVGHEILEKPVDIVHEWKPSGVSFQRQGRSPIVKIMWLK